MAFNFYLTDATNAFTTPTGIDISTNLFTLKHGLYFAQGNASTDNNWPYTGWFMGLIEKRGTTDGTGPNYHCTITCWNESDGKEYNNLFAYDRWSGWRITYTNKNKPTASDVNAPTKEEFNSLKTSVSEGKSLIAAAVTDKGVNTAADASFSTMASNIRSISTQSSISSSTLSVSSNKITVKSGYTLWSNMFVCITKVHVGASDRDNLDSFYYGTDFTMSFSQSGTTVSIPEKDVYVGGGNYGYVSAREVVVYYVN